MNLAHPDDPDLDIDIDGIWLTSVVRCGADFHVMATGGFGRWVNAKTRQMAEVDTVTEVELTWGLPRLPAPLLDAMEKRLRHWHDTGTPLRLIGAPGKMGCLIEDFSTFIPIPRAP